MQGAVMVYTAALAAVLAIMVLFVYNSGHIANEKTRLQNTTDAAVYSVAMLEARDLNFQAYTNRSMVANQVAIAQAISLASWFRFLDNFVTHIQQFTSWVPYWGAFITYIKNVLTQIDNVYASNVAPGFIGIENTLEQVLSTSQSIMHAATFGQALFVLNDVVKANDPGVSTGLISTAPLFLKSLSDFNGAVSQYDPAKAKNSSGDDKKRMDEFQGVTMRSRDPFTTSRTRRWGVTIPAGVIQFRFERGGGAELLGANGNGPYYTWAAMDTLSAHQRKWRLFKGWSSWKEAVPLGWGAAQTDSQTIYYASNRGSKFGGTWNVNPMSSSLAAGQYQSAKKVGKFDGLRKFEDLTDKGLLETMPSVVVLLTKSQGGNNGVKSARDSGFTPAGSQIDIDEKGGMANNQLHAVAKAEAYFSRPNDLWSRVGQREYGNTYDPYWQVRLVSVTTAEKFGAVALSNIQ